MIAILSVLKMASFQLEISKTKMEEILFVQG